MTHYSYEEWLRYVRNELDGQTREKYEDHLYTCDTCLDVYIQAVSEEETSLPSISDEGAFTDSIMQMIADDKLIDVVPMEKGKKKLYQQAIFHYTLAAAMTLILMSTGAFHNLIKTTGHLQKTETLTKQESITMGVLDKTTSLVSTLDGLKKEDKKK